MSTSALVYSKVDCPCLLCRSKLTPGNESHWSGIVRRHDHGDWCSRGRAGGRLAVRQPGRAVDVLHHRVPGAAQRRCNHHPGKGKPFSKSPEHGLVFSFLVACSLGWVWFLLQARLEEADLL